MNQMNQGQPQTYCIPHGGACAFCGETKPDVYADDDGNDTCAKCDRYDDYRRLEFRKEKSRFWQRKHGGTRS